MGQPPPRRALWSLSEPAVGRGGRDLFGRPGLPGASMVARCPLLDTGWLNPRLTDFAAQKGHASNVLRLALC